VFHLGSTVNIKAKNKAVLNEKYRLVEKIG